MAVVPLRDGKALNVFCLGRGEPVILLHGFGFHGLQWLPNILPLTHRYRFYLPDLRGFGQSHLTAFSQHCVFSTYAQDLGDVIDHFKLNDVILGGVSTGAFTCGTGPFLPVECGPCQRGRRAAQGSLPSNLHRCFAPDVYGIRRRRSHRSATRRSPGKCRGTACRHKFRTDLPCQIARNPAFATATEKPPVIRTRGRIQYVPGRRAGFVKSLHSAWPNAERDDRADPRTETGP